MKTSIAIQLVVELKDNVLQNGGYPTCFKSKAEYDSWQKHEKIVHTEPVRNLICEDCTACYQRKMRMEDRCANIFFTVKDKNLADPDVARAWDEVVTNAVC